MCSSAACVRVVNEVLYGAAFVCCRNCWNGKGDHKSVRQQLIRLRDSTPSTFEACTLELCIGDRFLFSAQPGQSFHLDTVFNEGVLVDACPVVRCSHP